MKTAKNRTESRIDSRRRRNRPSIFEHLAGAATLAELQRACEEPKFFDYLLDASENMDQTTGKLYVGLRELGRRHHGMSDSTAYRRGKALETRGIWTITRDAGRHSYGGRPTCLYTVNPHYLPALIHARHLFRPDWHQRFRKEPSEAAVCFTDEAKGEADRTRPRNIKPSTETSESPTPEETRACNSLLDVTDGAGNDFFDGGCADGCATAPPADISNAQKPKIPERSSNAPLHPRDAAARSEINFHPIKRRRGARAPDGPTLKRCKHKWHLENVVQFATEQNAPYEDLLKLYAEDQPTIDHYDHLMRAADWRPPPGVRTEHRLYRRASGVDPAEREKRKHYLMAKVARWKEVRGRPGDVAKFWAAMSGPDAKDEFDRAVKAYRESGWEDRG